MPQTADLVEYQDGMKYCVKQARVIQIDKAATQPAASGPALDAALKDNTTGAPKDSGSGPPSYTPEEEEQWALMMKGGGEG